MKLSKPSPNITHLGTFVKTNSVHVIEILGLSSLDFGVLDAEHAPLDRSALDLLMLAGRAANWPLIVRIPDTASSTILSVLDIGAAGLLVPHVDSAQQARAVVAKVRYRGGERGFSSSPRAARYGTLGMKECLSAAEGSLVVAQIESETAVDSVEDILTVDGIDGIFIGRADLALSFGLDNLHHARVSQATEHAINSARSAGKIAGIAVGNVIERDAFAEMGANWIVVGSDQSLLRQAAQAAATPSRVV
ncbi:aldolase/citrate lyase family protein [Paralcaligenes sp. KSB-10]|uniref:HpcH/HpaI aldolase family protein n=1 Tax=Paralcaligenes sp. KSB-10 TaxID=2901142 RepID=UPI001E48DEB9|nr:aldolase/citrate lyase family protein [Paralcaligenes sp. KSB-10]UHL64666.1 aldolase/citrate lyase family protein [Paralcaligenes sp. KSB-10]